MNTKPYFQACWKLSVILIIIAALLAGCSVPEGTTVPTDTTVPTTSPLPQPSTTTAPTTVPTQPTTVPTQPPTEPTEPPQPTEPAPEPFPEELAENVYLSCKNNGYCKAMTGKVMITIVFLSDSVSSWDSAAVAEAKSKFDKDLPKFETEAAAYGTELDVNITYLESKILSAYDANDQFLFWAKTALNKHGLGQALYNSELLERYYNVDSAPVVFVLNREGRAYAMSSGGANTFEYVLMYSSELTAIRHELCHVFGAMDFYFPEETEQAAKEHLSDSIMLDSVRGTVDELSAYLIGWTDTLLPNAESFLRATNHITMEYLEQANQQNGLTGYGTKEFKHGTYTGYMVSGVPHGEGTCVFHDGSVYSGNWENGLRSGYGEETQANGTVYKGQWVADQMHGQGTLYYADGKQVYVGEFQNGKRHGQGTHTFADGDVYTGQWKNGVWDGEGTYTWVTGEVYTGQWSLAVQNGQGTMTWPNGVSYTGAWVKGKRTGYGVLTYADGRRYEGEFKNNKRHGQGTLYYTDGTVEEGIWENDQLVEKPQA